MQRKEEIEEFRAALSRLTQSVDHIHSQFDLAAGNDNLPDAAIEAAGSDAVAMLETVCTRFFNKWGE